MIIWLNGELVDEEHATLSPSDRGLLLSDGLFETLRAAPHGIVDLDRHVDRLHQGMDYFGIPLFYSQAQLESACDQVLKANDLKKETASLRITVTRGPGPRGLTPPNEPHPTLFITAGPTPEPMSGSSLITATIRRNEHSPTARFKTLAYADNVLAKREALKVGADDALLLNSKDRVVCASAANVWIVEGVRLVTPPVSEGALPGIVRERLIELAPNLDYDVIEEPLTQARLASANEIFLTNSLIGICAATSVDGKRVAGGKVAAHLSRAYVDAVSFN